MISDSEEPQRHGDKGREQRAKGNEFQALRLILYALRSMPYALCIILLLLAVAFQSSFASEEEYGAEFLQQLTSAEIDGIGESLAAYPTGVHALNNNPAGLAYTEGSELLINAHKLPRITAVIMRVNEDGKWEDYGRYNVEPTEMGLINYALPLGRFGNLGMGFVFHYGGRFIRVDEEGKAVNAFPKDDLAFTIGYSLKISRGISVGFDVKSVRSKVPVDDGSSSRVAEREEEKLTGRTYAADIGFLHQMGKRVRVGAVLQNIGNELSFNTSEANLESPEAAAPGAREETFAEIPSSLRRKLLVGAVYTLRDTENSVLSLSMDVNPPFEDGLRYNLGAELLYAQCLVFRIGYMRSTQTYHDFLLNLYDQSSVREERVWIRRGLTIGMGLRFKGTEINFATAPRREPILKDGEKSRLEEHDSIMSFSCVARF